MVLSPRGEGKVTNVRLLAPSDEGAGCALAQTEGEKSSSQNQQTYLNWVGALSLLPPAYGVAFQSMIETSAVCLKADRQTILVCRLAPTAPSSEGARERAHPVPSSDEEGVSATCRDDGRRELRKF